MTRKMCLLSCLCVSLLLGCTFAADTEGQLLMETEQNSLAQMSKRSVPLPPTLSAEGNDKENSKPMQSTFKITTGADGQPLGLKAGEDLTPMPSGQMESPVKGQDQPLNRQADRMNAATQPAIETKQIPSKADNNIFISSMGPYVPAVEESQPVMDWPYPYSKGFPPKGLLIAVISAPTHSRARIAFRRNWELYKRSLPAQDVSGIDLKFFIGQLDMTKEGMSEVKIQLENEQQQHQDIVRLSGFVENYRNLTLKTMNIVTWAHYQRYGGLFKVDDDTFLRLDNFLEFLKAEMNPRMIYAGYFVSDVPVITSPPTSKWYCDRYPYDIFPDYASGPGYFIGAAVMEFLVTNQNQLVDYQIEDAAMGIWTQKMAAIDRVNLRVSAYLAYCEDGPDLIWVNPLEPEEMERMGENVLQGDMCSNYVTPHTCIKSPCLCSPKGENCTDDDGNAWQNYAKSGYEEASDLRLIQVDEKSTSSNLSPARLPTIMMLMKDAVTLT